MGIYIYENVCNRGLGSFIPITLIFLTVLCRKETKCINYRFWLQKVVESGREYFFRIRVIKLCVVIFAEIPSKWSEASFWFGTYKSNFLKNVLDWSRVFSVLRTCIWLQSVREYQRVPEQSVGSSNVEQSFHFYFFFQLVL